MKYFSMSRSEAASLLLLSCLVGGALTASPFLLSSHEAESQSESAVSDSALHGESLSCCADFVPGTDPRFVQAITKALHEKYGGGGDFTPIARWPGANGDPIELTWSFVPDGTPLSGSTLFAKMDGNYSGSGGRAAWIAFFTDAFARWDELTGIKFTRVVVENEADDGAPWGQPGQPGLRGDIRIRATNLNNTSLLAFAQLPNMIGAGDITFNADAWVNWQSTPWMTPAGTGFERTTCHEIGHAIGLDHVFPSTSVIDTKLMTDVGQPVGESSYGPQHDDLRGGQEFYGDFAEPNDSVATAWPFALPTQTLPAPTAFIGRASVHPRGWFTVGTDTTGMGTLSIDSPSDVDVFELSVTQKTATQISLVEVGLMYQAGPTPGQLSWINSEFIYDLQLELLDRTGAVIATATPAGDSINAALRVVGEPYYVRVSRVPGSTGQTEPQQYELQFTLQTATPCGSGGVVCDDGNPTNGTENCEPDGSCSVTYIADCNDNGVEDSHDISTGSSIDCNNNGVPDECECDCNGNGRDDACDIAQGSSDDFDANGQPDECQSDCNANGLPDAYDIAQGNALDENDNQVPDSCESTLLVPAQFPTIRSAILNADDGDTILVGPGTWSGPENSNLVVHDKTVQIIAEQGPLATTIDTNYAARAFVLTATPRYGINRTRVEGFAIRRAQTPIADPYGPHGGAIYIDHAEATIDRCYFSDCHALDGGGAIAVSGGEPYCWGPHPQVFVQNSMFWANVSTQGGAIYSVNGASPILVNCTIALNSAGSNGTGGGVKSADALTGPALVSCIVWQNVPLTSQLAGGSGTSTLITQYCDLPTQHQAQYGNGLGNIFVDPQLVNLATGDLHLKNVSPCKNTGSTSLVRGDLDIDGQVRVWGLRVDIGADELKYKILQGP